MNLKLGDLVWININEKKYLTSIDSIFAHNVTVEDSINSYNNYTGESTSNRLFGSKSYLTELTNEEKTKHLLGTLEN